MSESQCLPPPTRGSGSAPEPPNKPQEVQQAANYTERVLSEAQRSRMDAQQINTWLQAELDSCRTARRQQEALAVEAQQRAAALEVGRPAGPAECTCFAFAAHVSRTASKPSR